MAAEMMRIAALDKAKLTKVQTLEKKMGCCLVALQPAPRLARLSDAQLEQVQSAEKELGVVLLAYEAK